MNESMIIMSGMVVMTIIALYLIYKVCGYLYEVYIEYFTSDPNPDAPDDDVLPEGTEYLIKKWFNLSLWIENTWKDVKVSFTKAVDEANKPKKVRPTNPPQRKVSRRPHKEYHNLYDEWHGNIIVDPIEDKAASEEVLTKEINKYCDKLHDMGYGLTFITKHRRKLRRDNGLSPEEETKPDKPVFEWDTRYKEDVWDAKYKEDVWDTK